MILYLVLGASLVLLIIQALVYRQRLKLLRAELAICRDEIHVRTRMAEGRGVLSNVHGFVDRDGVYHPAPGYNIILENF